MSKVIYIQVLSIYSLKKKCYEYISLLMGIGRHVDHAGWNSWLKSRYVNINIRN